MKLVSLLLNEDVKPWKDNPNAEALLKSLKGVIPKKVGFLNHYTVPEIKNLTGDYKELYFTENGTYTAWNSKLNQQDTSGWDYDINGKRIKLYDDQARKTLLGYLFRNAAGYPEYKEAEKPAPKKKIPGMPGNESGWWETAKFIARNPGIWQSILFPPAESEIDALLGILDWAGFIELYGIGMIADTLAAVIHTNRGDYFNAALSAIAIIPFASAGVKSLKIGLKGTRAQKLINQIQDKNLNETDRSKAAVALYALLVENGSLSRSALDKMASGYRSVAKYILGLSSKGKIDTYDSAINETASFLETLARGADSAAEKIAKSNKLTASGSIISPIAAIVKSKTKGAYLIESLKKTTWGNNILGGFMKYVTGFPDAQIKLMNKAIRRGFLNSIKKNADKINSIIKIAKPGDLDKLTTAMKNSPYIKSLKAQADELKGKLDKLDPDSVEYAVINNQFKELTGRANALNRSIGTFTNNIIPSYKSPLLDKDGNPTNRIVPTAFAAGFNFGEQFIKASKISPELDSILLDWLQSTNNVFYLDWFNNVGKQINTIGFVPWAKGAGIFEKVGGIASSIGTSMTGLKKWLDIIASEASNHMSEEEAKSWNLNANPATASDVVRNLVEGTLLAKLKSLWPGGDGKEPGVAEVLEAMTVESGLGYDEDIKGGMQTTSDSTAAAKAATLNKKP